MGDAELTEFLGFGFCAPVWGTEGREFKSSQPDKQCAGQTVFPESTLWPVVALGA